VTIDLNRADLPAETIDAAEALANEIVWDNRTVAIRDVSREEAAALPLRKTPPGRDGRLRLIDIEGFDLTACGGTHVARTGEIGLIKVVKTERRGALLRVEFLCGGRALSDYHEKHEIIRSLSASLTTGPAELMPSVVKLQEEAKGLRNELRLRESALLGFEAEQLLAAAEPLGDARLVTRVFTGREPNELRRLATLLVEAGQTVALLGIAGESAHLIFCRSADAPGSMGDLIRPALAALAARGGGGPAMAQGGGPPAGEAEVAGALAAAVERLRNSGAS
jgi:alanyl-tRNA synthetase